MKRHFCASVFVINPEDKKILLVKHRHFNRWVQPGGHIEYNEVPEETAIREAYEETGIKVKILGERFPREDDYIRPLGIQKNRGSQGDLHIDVIYAAIPNGNIEPNFDDEETANVRWFTREELELLNVFEDIKITYDYIMRTYFN